MIRPGKVMVLALYDYMGEMAVIDAVNIIVVFLAHAKVTENGLAFFTCSSLGDWCLGSAPNRIVEEPA